MWVVKLTFLKVPTVLPVYGTGSAAQRGAMSGSQMRGDARGGPFLLQLPREFGGPGSLLEGRSH